MATAGHGHHHEHYAVALGDLPIFILRSEAGYRSVAERAADIMRKLNATVIDRGGSFVVISGNPRIQVAYRHANTSPMPLLEVMPGDVVAYQRRSMGPVSASRLGAYWAALLNDYSRTLLFREQPHEITALHLGASLNALYENLLQKDNGAPIQLAAAIDHLGSEDKDHLLELATRVPAEFRERKEGPP